MITGAPTEYFLKYLLDAWFDQLECVVPPDIRYFKSLVKHMRLI